MLKKKHVLVVGYEPMENWDYVSEYDFLWLKNQLHYFNPSGILGPDPPPFIIYPLLTSQFVSGRVGDLEHWTYKCLHLPYAALRSSNWSTLGLWNAKRKRAR